MVVQQLDRVVQESRSVVEVIGKYTVCVNCHGVVWNSLSNQMEAVFLFFEYFCLYFHEDSDYLFNFTIHVPS